MPFDEIGVANAEDQLLGHHGHRRGVLDPGQHDDKLVAAQTRHHITVAHTILEAMRHFDQQFVTDMVPEGIIDALEAIQIDEQQGKAAAFPPGSRQRLIKPPLQAVPIEQSGTSRIISRSGFFMGISFRINDDMVRYSVS